MKTFRHVEIDRRQWICHLASSLHPHQAGWKEVGRPHCHLEGIRVKPAPALHLGHLQEGSMFTTRIPNDEN